ncbi:MULTISPECIES: hypothetical protein [unclassified Arthrobacter]|uniref:hypothetical protein n=1 Tax=unclassified Arthrobacter TaxID=235627 RepID=UPI001490C30A|nr:MULTISPECIES: hypothetical protein [unclassified Arthrobacter]MBE0009608.1 hypothetical protein [Arthrobacter sp. AET 35A]NOJ63359.1 hypothetical protein [Arthrobacter sp. 147(2020)]
MNRERQILELISEYVQQKARHVPEGSGRGLDEIADEFGQALRNVDAQSGEETIPPIVQRASEDEMQA